MTTSVKKKFVIKKKNPISQINEKIDKCNAVINDPSFNDRVSMDNWVLNDKRSFPDFINKFTEKVVEPRIPITKWKDNQKIEINPFSQQKLVPHQLLLAHFRLSHQV